jgi:hypothetical protein
MGRRLVGLLGSGIGLPLEFVSFFFQLLRRPDQSLSIGFHGDRASETPRSGRHLSLFLRLRRVRHGMLNCVEGTHCG